MSTENGSSRDVFLDDRSSGSWPRMASRTTVQSAAPLQKGPSLSCQKVPDKMTTVETKTSKEAKDNDDTKLSDMLITPVRPTVPNVGRNAVTPHLAAGKVIDPAVSEPIANGTIPAINQQFQ